MDWSTGLVPQHSQHMTCSLKLDAINIVCYGSGSKHKNIKNEIMSCSVSLADPYRCYVRGGSVLIRVRLLDKMEGNQTVFLEIVMLFAFLLRNWRSTEIVFG